MFKKYLRNIRYLDAYLDDHNNLLKKLLFYTD